MGSDGMSIFLEEWGFLVMNWGSKLDLWERTDCMLVRLVVNPDSRGCG